MQDQFTFEELNQRKLCAKKKVTASTSVLLLLFLLLVGIMFGSTYAIFYSSASVSGTMRFIILSESGHQCTLEIDNVSIAYDGTGTGVNNGKTVIQITPLNSAAYTYPDTLSITFNSSSITPTTSGDVLTYSQSSTTICTYNKSNGKVYIENDAVEDHQ